MRQDERAKEMTRQQHQTAYVCRARFMRKGALSYIGHLDLKTVFERAVRRAELPLLYSQGYNPRPMLVFALPIGVGIDTTGDYVDVSMSVPVDAEEFKTKVNEELPDGLKVLEAITIDEPKRSLMSVVTVAEYDLEAKGITQAVIDLFAREEVLVERKSKGKVKVGDIRPLMIKPIPSPDPDKAHIMVYAGSTQNLRPDVLLEALCVHEGYSREEAAECRVTRTALYGGEYPDIEGIERLV